MKAQKNGKPAKASKAVATEQPVMPAAGVEKIPQEEQGNDESKFREWLDTVEDYNNGDVELQMGVTLSPLHWMQLASIASKNEWHIDNALTYVLEHGLEDWEPHERRAAEISAAITGRAAR